MQLAGAAIVREQFGDPHVLVNNAELAHFAPGDEMTPAQFDETLAVNLRRMFLMTRAVLPAMKARGSEETT